MTTKILADSEICISVPLNVLFHFIFAFYQEKQKNKNDLWPDLWVSDTFIAWFFKK